MKTLANKALAVSVILTVLAFIAIAVIQIIRLTELGYIHWDR